MEYQVVHVHGLKVTGCGRTAVVALCRHVGSVQAAASSGDLWNYGPELNGCEVHFLGGCDLVGCWHYGHVRGSAYGYCDRRWCDHGVYQTSGHVTSSRCPS